MGSSWLNHKAVTCPLTACGLVKSSEMQSGANALCPLSLACVQRQVEDWTWPDSTHLNVLNWEKQVPLVHIWKNCNSFWKFTVKANVLCDIHMFTPSGQVTRQLKVYAWSSANRPLNLSIKTMTTSAINHMTTPPSGPVTNLLSLKRFTCWWNCATNWPITCRPKGATEPPTCWCHLPGWPMACDQTSSASHQKNSFRTLNELITGGHKESAQSVNCSDQLIHVSFQTFLLIYCEIVFSHWKWR